MESYIINDKSNFKKEYNTIIIRKNYKKIKNINTNVNNEIIDDIMRIYLSDPNNTFDFDNYYKLDIWKGKKNYMSICSFDNKKLEKVMKLLNYNFLNL